MALFPRTSFVPRVSRGTVLPNLQFGLTVDQQKSFFFDRSAWNNVLKPAERAMLSKVGAFVRQRARKSLRFRNRVSFPVIEAPTSWTGLLRKQINFFYDPVRGSVVIGPGLLPGKDHPPGSTIPRLLEQGGIGANAKRYLPRPYMLPAFKAVLEDELHDELQDYIHKSRLTNVGRVA